ncbi:hypothetical protein CsSME_00041223 [Camellia sinensis var. sinensis]
MAPPPTTKIIFLTLLVQLCTTTISTTVAANTTNATTGTGGKIPAIFIFGDSLLDTGTNTFLPTGVRADHAPYGENFPRRVPTGRFSNGRLMSDMLASHLGIKYTVPSFLELGLSNEDIVTGVCFASAGSGYDDTTNAAAGIIPVLRQVDYLRMYITRLRSFVGAVQANRTLNDALVVVSSGSNDVTASFYDSPDRPGLFIGAYHDFLLSRLQTFVQELYGQGLRNMIIFGLPPIGCFPGEISAKFRIDRSCVENENSDSESYNQKLVARLAQLQPSLPGTKLVYGDIYTPLYDMVKNPLNYGFEVVDRGCCATGFVETGPFCSISTPVCPNPDKFVFFDAAHPTEATYRHVAQSLQKQALPQFL